jgi:prepilin-type N-terminal cleavage/methylation domain-containing protein
MSKLWQHWLGNRDNNHNSPRILPRSKLPASCFTAKTPRKAAWPPAGETHAAAGGSVFGSDDSIVQISGIAFAGIPVIKRMTATESHIQRLNVRAKATDQAGPHTVGFGANSAFTLMEVVISLAILGMSLGGILTLYVRSAQRADWSGYSVSAQMMALSGLEQCRAAKYDPHGSPPTDALVSTNFPARVDILDPGTSSGMNSYGTNITTILMVCTNPELKMVRVDCTWTYPGRGVFTNSVFTYRAANQ